MSRSLEIDGLTVSNTPRALPAPGLDLAPSAAGRHPVACAMPRLVAANNPEDIRVLTAPLSAQQALKKLRFPADSGPSHQCLPQQVLDGAGRLNVPVGFGTDNFPKGRAVFATVGFGNICGGFVPPPNAMSTTFL